MHGELVIGGVVGLALGGGAVWLVLWTLAIRGRRTARDTVARARKEAEEV
ncbi:MAG: hypothetical protein GYA73_02690, partial [Planctomycetes bacterium]|nr:hypothetical protein [Planctomycetota bacterium]